VVLCGSAHLDCACEGGVRPEIETDRDLSVLSRAATLDPCSRESKRQDHHVRISIKESFNSVPNNSHYSDSMIFNACSDSLFRPSSSRHENVKQEANLNA